MSFNTPAIPAGTLAKVVNVRNDGFVDVMPFVPTFKEDGRKNRAFAVKQNDMLLVISDPFDDTLLAMVDTQGNRKIAVFSSEHCSGGWIWSDYLELF